MTAPLSLATIAHPWHRLNNEVEDAEAESVQEACIPTERAFSEVRSDQPGS